MGSANAPMIRNVCWSRGPTGVKVSSASVMAGFAEMGSPVPVPRVAGKVSQLADLFIYLFVVYFRENYILTFQTLFQIVLQNFNS
jgi:hypothetical protein